MSMRTYFGQINFEIQIEKTDDPEADEEYANDVSRRILAAVCTDPAVVYGNDERVEEDEQNVPSP